MIKYLRTKGRINRIELFVLTLVVLILESTTYLIWGKDSDIFLTISIFLFVIYLMQCAKRYHDINKWGINGFVWWIIPVLNLVYFFQLYFSKGADNANKYGEPSDFRISSKKHKQPDNSQKPEMEQQISNNLGEFTTKDFPTEDRSKAFYFIKYSKPDGEWVEIDEPICEIRVGEKSGYFYKSASVIASKSGILEHIINKDCKLEEKMIFYKLHEKGIYKNENTIEKDEYKHYFLFDKVETGNLGLKISSSNSSFSFDRWIVNDGNFVKKGDEIYKYKDSKHNEFTHKAKKDGYIHIIEPGKIYSIEKNELLYYIRKQDSQRVLEKYQNKPTIVVDDFTKSKSIVWDRVSTKSRLEYGIISKSDDGLVDLNFTLNYLQNEDKIVFHFNPKQIKPKQNDKVSFLFESGELVEFCLNSNPVSIKNQNNEKVLEYKSSLTKTELELFVNVDFKKWKIGLVNENREILGGEKGSIIDYESKENLITVIKKFGADYTSAVLTNISDYQPIETREIEASTDKKDNACYVYLMHDTANGYYKIGISNKPYYREKTLQSEKPTIELIASKKFPVRKIAESIEKSLHSVYDDKRLRGEWFELDENDVKNIIESLK